jgi:hypothetical protein
MSVTHFKTPTIDSERGKLTKRRRLDYLFYYRVVFPCRLTADLLT